ncbi:MAG: amidohydrolase [Actinobacteria bacterium]|nr:MAG: amidohydrolase [Actinomycetota bacterium]
MGMPTGIGIIDTMIGFPHRDMKEAYRFITRQTRDKESKEDFEFPVEYMFKDVPNKGLKDVDDPVSTTLREMDLWGIEKGLVGLAGSDSPGARAVQDHPDRFLASLYVDPNRGMDGIRAIQKAHDRYDIRAVELFPAGTSPQVAINDKLMYPVYAKCVELGIAVFCCAGVPGPQLIDEVMYDFPELVFVTRHGCEPWTELMVKLMLKWPNLYYSTSAFAPRYYPKHILDYANTRGADKLIYAGYFPMGLSLERIMTEMAAVPLKDEVWPKFLRDNASRVLRLGP